MTVDITFNVHSDARGGDPDITSPTLRLFHKILWSKALPNGQTFELTNRQSGAYLYHKSEIGEFFLGSDAITHSYRHHKRKNGSQLKFRMKLTNFLTQVQQLVHLQFSQTNELTKSTL